MVPSWLQTRALSVFWGRPPGPRGALRPRWAPRGGPPLRGGHQGYPWGHPEYRGVSWGTREPPRVAQDTPAYPRAPLGSPGPVVIWGYSEGTPGFGPGYPEGTSGYSGRPRISTGVLLGHPPGVSPAEHWEVPLGHVGCPQDAGGAPHVPGGAPVSREALPVLGPPGPQTGNSQVSWRYAGVPLRYPQGAPQGLVSPGPTRPQGTLGGYLRGTSRVPLG